MPAITRVSISGAKRALNSLNKCNVETRRDLVIAHRFSASMALAVSEYGVHVFPGMRPLVGVGSPDDGKLVKGAAREL